MPCKKAGGSRNDQTFSGALGPDGSVGCGGMGRGLPASGARNPAQARARGRSIERAIPKSIASPGGTDRSVGNLERRLVELGHDAGLPAPAAGGALSITVPAGRIEE